MNKYTSVKDINKNGNYYKKNNTVYFINGSGNDEVMAIATDSLNTKKIMTALYLTERLLNEKSA
jgi:hypothetical protein